jgi:hypothetical protein
MIFCTAGIYRPHLRWCGEWGMSFNLDYDEEADHADSTEKINQDQ